VAAADSDYLQNEHTLRQRELQGKILPATTQPLPQDMKNICQNSMLIIAYGKCANLDHTVCAFSNLPSITPFKYTYNKANSQKLIHHLH
jgi:hypothetical protein